MSEFKKHNAKAGFMIYPSHYNKAIDEIEKLEQQNADCESTINVLSENNINLAGQNNRLREALVSQRKTINYCIGHIHEVRLLKYIERLCRNTEKILKATK